MGKDITSKKKEIEELQLSLIQDEQAIERLECCRRERSMVLEKIKHCIKKTGELDDRLKRDANYLSKHDKDEIQHQIDQVVREQQALNEKRRELEEAIAAMEKERVSSGVKNFDKYPCLANIRTLVDRKGVKLGDIERAAGMTAGYMSRLEKEGNNSDPSVEFIITAAKMLGVGLEELIYGDFRKLSAKEEKIYQFLHRLKKDTSDGKLLWTVKSMDELSEEIEESNEEQFKNYPLKVKKSAGDNRIYIETLFDDATSYVLGGPWIFCRFSQDAFIHVLKLGSENYEVYIYTTIGTIHPLMRTKNMELNQLTESVDSLFKLVEEFNSDVRLSPGIESIIDSYLQ